MPPYVDLPPPWDPPALTVTAHPLPQQGCAGWEEGAEGRTFFYSLFLPSVLMLSSPLVCSHSIVFSVSLQSMFLQSYCCFADFDTPWYQCNFSSIALVQQQWTEPLTFISFCPFLFSLCIAVKLFLALMSSLSVALSNSLSMSLILNFSFFFHFPVCVHNDALFLVLKQIFQGWFVFTRVWKTLSFSFLSDESLYTFMLIYVVFFQSACSH